MKIEDIIPSNFTKSYVDKLINENTTLKKALEFYADKDMWHFVKDGDFKCRINYDDVVPYYLENPKTYSCGGKHAREALKKIEELNKE